MADLVTCDGVQIHPFDNPDERIYRHVSPNQQKADDIAFGWRYDKKEKTWELGVSLDRARCITGDPRANLPNHKRHYYLLSLTVRQFPTRLDDPPTKFQLEHVPLKDVNHAHSELRKYDGGDAVASIPSRDISSWYRQEIQKLLDSKLIDVIEPLQV